MFGQILAVTLLNLRNVPARLGPSLVAVLGVAGVVAVLCATLAIKAGFRAALGQAGAADVVIVTRSGSDTELSSNLAGAEVKVLADNNYIVRAGGEPLASPELYVLVDLLTRGKGTPANVPLRGVGAKATAVREHFRIVAGRMFRPGLFEIIVGSGAAANFRAVGVGSTLRLGGTPWTVVGVFEDGGSVTESELWTDVTVLQGAYRRGNSYQSFRARVTEPAAVARFAAELKGDPRVDVLVRSEQDYYAAQAKALTGVVSGLGGAIVVLMGLGAVFAALNTMYSAVAARTREIATLRALGFGALPVLTSVLIEALVLGLAGGLCGGLAAYLAFDGFQASTLNFQTFSQLSFAFRVTPGVLSSGIAYGLLLSLLGGIGPAVAAARLPVTAGLRA